MVIEPNLAWWDRAVRIAVAVVIVVACAKGFIPGGASWLALLLGGALLVNGIAGRCAIYSLLGLSTCKIRKK